MAADYNDLIALRDRLSASPGWPLLQHIRRVARFAHVFLDNWRELDALIGRFRADTAFALEAWGPNGQHIDRFLDTIDRPLHNFLASAKTLVDQSRRLAAVSLADGTEVRAEHDRRRDELFANRPRSRFVTDLRNYMLHYDLPSTLGSWEWIRGESLVHFITLDCDSLRLWDDWKALALEYIDSHAIEVDLHDTLSAYVSDVRTFQTWFGAAVVEAHLDDLEESLSIAREHDSLVLELARAFDQAPDSS